MSDSPFICLISGLVIGGLWSFYSEYRKLKQMKEKLREAKKKLKDLEDHLLLQQNNNKRTRNL